MNLHHYLRILRRGLWLIALLTVAGGLIGAGAAAVAEPEYQVRATNYVSVVGGGSTGDLQQGNVFAMQKAESYAALVGTAAVLDLAAADLGAGTTVGDLRGSVSASARSSTSLIDISASGSDPQLVAERANAVARALAEAIADLDALDAPVAEGAAAPAPITMTVIEPAAVPTVAVAPQPRYAVAAGAVIGLAIGVIVLVLREAFDTRIRTLGDLPRGGGIVTRTAIPGRVARGSRAPLRDVRLESFRTLRGNLQFGTRVGPSIAVAGVDAATDSTVVAQQLALVFGEIGFTVVIVDVDLRDIPRGRRVKRAADDTAREAGIADVLRQRASLPMVIQPTDVENVSRIATGSFDKTSAQLLSTTVMETALRQLQDQFSLVILSCPPLVERSEAAVVAALARNTLVVVEAGATEHSSMMHALELLEGVQVKQVSVVLENTRDATRPELGVAIAPLPA